TWNRTRQAGPMHASAWRASPVEGTRRSISLAWPPWWVRSGAQPRHAPRGGTAASVVDLGLPGPPQDAAPGRGADHGMSAPLRRGDARQAADREATVWHAQHSLEPGSTSVWAAVGGPRRLACGDSEDPGARSTGRRRAGPSRACDYES